MSLLIEHGGSWENGYAESFNGKLHNELLARNVFYTLNESAIFIER